MTISKIPTEPIPSPNEVGAHTVRRRLISVSALVVVIAAVSLICYRVLSTLFPYCPPNCNFTPEYSPANFESELEKNQSKWETQHITHYQMSLDPGYSSANYGHTPYVIEVKDGEVISVVDAHGDMVSFEDEQSFAYSERKLFTVSGLFSYVHQTFLEKPPIIRVTYDTTYGYPAYIFVDPYVEPCCQDFSIDVLEFHVLP